MAGRNLGEFGGAVPEEHVDQFGYLGQVIRTNPLFSDLDVVDYIEGAEALAKSKAVYADGLKLMKAFLRRAIHVDDFDLFWSTAREHGQDVGDLGDVCSQLLGAVAGRPTRTPADSSGGRTRTRAKSAAGSYSPVTTQALQQLQGRPDLQLMVLEANEARTA